jgi:hypothetical protein
MGNEAARSLIAGLHETTATASKSVGIRQDESGGIFLNVLLMRSFTLSTRSESTVPECEATAMPTWGSGGSISPTAQDYPQIDRAGYSFCLKRRYIFVTSCKMRNPRHMTVGPGG